MPSKPDTIYFRSVGRLMNLILKRRDAVLLRYMERKGEWEYQSSFVAETLSEGWKVSQSFEDFSPIPWLYRRADRSRYKIIRTDFVRELNGEKVDFFPYCVDVLLCYDPFRYFFREAETENTPFWFLDRMYVIDVGKLIEADHGLSGMQYVLGMMTEILPANHSYFIDKYWLEVDTWYETKFGRPK